MYNTYLFDIGSSTLKLYSAASSFAASFAFAAVSA
jgi:hypothetical protein